MSDAGTKADEHYQRNMAPWRFYIRQRLLRYIRPESAILAHMQHTFRRPWLDYYFAITANIGAHTFYMVMLPVIFWFVDYDMGLNYVLVLALGVFITGVVKDLLCLPRPASPPCHRISMSGSAKLEYGMPSTHSSNAVGVALLVLERSPTSPIARYIVAWLLATLVLGRLYTSMHGFIDVTVGLFLGYISHVLRKLIMTRLSVFSFVDNLVMTILSIAAITACPDPVDACPCFDDSVAFIGVVLGIIWTPFLFYVPTKVVYSVRPQSFGVPSAVMNPFYAVCDFLFSRFNYCERSIWRAFISNYILIPPAVVITGKEAVYRGLARYFVGVALIIFWRHFSKRMLLRILVPIWHVLGIKKNPRSAEVCKSSKLTPDSPIDAFPDSKEEVEEILKTIKKSQHGVSDHVGPQSEADLYELQALQKSKKPVTPHHNSIQKPRDRLNVEVYARLLVYAGIAPVTLGLGHIIFNILYI